MLRAFSITLLSLLALASSASAETVDFRRQVMAVLSRAGCNAGTCHGNLNGKGGFKLSLRGESPERDHLALTREQQGRRLNPLLPDDSLLLLKATGRIAHEGGPRFTPASQEYKLVRAWIEQGMPLGAKTAPFAKIEVSPAEAYLEVDAPTIAVRVWIHDAQGGKRDVTDLAVFESSNPMIEVTRQGLVETRTLGQATIVARYLDHQGTAQLAILPKRPGFAFQPPPTHNYIDTLVYQKLAKLQLQPSELSSDSEFLRRAYLDLLGLLPSAAEAKAFLADADPGKRAKLIDRLLERPEYAEWWALKWSDILRNEEKSLDRKGSALFFDWIRQALAENKPLNKFVAELVASRGSTYKEPAANYYRALREPYARSEAFAQVFLGIRMQCAKCHNHPFDRWTQNDYHQLAAFFPRVQYKILENTKRDKLDKHEFIGEQIVFMDAESEIKHPTTGDVLKPRFLGGPNLDIKTKDDRLKPLAEWLAAPENPFFARTQANRIWTHLLGRGIVDPNDDFRQSNPPINGPLLDALAQDFVKHGFDQKQLIRVIMNARVYQLSSTPNEFNADDEANFSRGVVRSLPAEALLDAIAQVTETKLAFEGYQDVKRAGLLPSMPSIRRSESFQGPFRFLKTFGKPERLLSCDCERSDQTTLAQALQMITGEVINKALAEPKNRLARLEKLSAEAALDELFLAALSRPASASERTALGPLLEASDRRGALEDLLWGILNSKDFLLRR